MSYKTFEINNGELTIKDAMYKGMAASKNNKLKTVSEETIANLKAEDEYKDKIDMDIFLDSDNWGESETPILDDMAESFGDMW